MSKSRNFTPSTPLTAARDRGPSPYFHGRERIQHNFKELLQRATRAGNGTTFLIQGAPGVGKTALVYECKKHALEGGWDVASITPPALWDSDELRYALGRGSRLSVTGGSGKVGVDKVVKIEASVDFSVDQPPTVLQVLRGGKKPLLLALDEAQVLGKEGVLPSDQVGVVNSVLNSVHNGDLDRPVILLAAGLGTTLTAFGRLGVSRFAKNCRIELGPLSKEAERAVIQDWLKKEGRAKGDPATWVEGIAREAHGWPHHILSYVEPAVEQLKADAGVMTPNGMSAVLEAGGKARLAYYQERAYDYPAEARQSLMKAFTDVSLGKSTTQSVILASLSQDFGPDRAAELFKEALRKGLLDERDGHYVIPIPSMHAWLKEEYGRERIEIPPAPTMGHIFQERGSGRER